MKTISRRATKKTAAIRAAVTHGQVYSLSNDFHPGEIKNMDYVWDTLASNADARLVDNEDGTYTVSVHGNLWYKLYT